MGVIQKGRNANEQQKSSGGSLDVGPVWPNRGDNKAKTKYDRQRLVVLSSHVRSRRSHVRSRRLHIRVYTARPSNSLLVLRPESVHYILLHTGLPVLVRTAAPNSADSTQKKYEYDGPTFFWVCHQRRAWTPAAGWIVAFHSTCYPQIGATQDPNPCRHPIRDPLESIDGAWLQL